MNATPSVGLYYNVPFERYLDWPAVSNSKLGLVAKSPAHCKAGFGEPTESMRLGSLTHCGVLEPAAIHKRYSVMPDFANDERNHTVKKVKGQSEERIRSYSASTNWVAEQKREWQKLNSDKEIVSRSHFDCMLAIATALCENERALSLFELGESEVSLFWFERVGSVDIPCKARIDWLAQDNGYFVDLKTCADASDFEWSIKKYGYSRQVAWYQRGLSKAGIVDALQPWIIAVETAAPFCTRAAPCSQSMIKQGWDECLRLLNIYAECTLSGEWPGYPNPVEWGEESDSVASWFDSQVQLQGQ